MLYHAQGKPVEATAGNCLLFTVRDRGIHLFTNVDRLERLRWPNRQDKLVAPFEFILNTEEAVPRSCTDLAMLFATISGHRLEHVSGRGAAGFTYQLTKKNGRLLHKPNGSLVHPAPGYFVRFEIRSTALMMTDLDNDVIRWPNMDDKWLLDWIGDSISDVIAQDFIVKMIFAGTSMHPVRLTSADNTYILEDG